MERPNVTISHDMGEMSDFILVVADSRSPEPGSREERTCRGGRRYAHAVGRNHGVVLSIWVISVFAKTELN